MKRIPLIIFLLLFCPLQSIAAEITVYGLTLSYSHDARICKKAAALLAKDNACRPHNNDNGLEKCGNDREFLVIVGGTPFKVFEELATNEYGYTQVFRSTGSSLSGFAIVYVQKALGRDSRLVETWKVNATDLDNVLKLPPGPIPYTQWVKMNPLPPKETNAVEFAAMLNRGEKLTDEWSPIIDIYGEPYLLERECSGDWRYGGYYACNKVIKLTVRKLFKDKKTVPYCQYSKTREKKK